MSFSTNKKSTTVASESVALKNPITFYKSKTGKYPSNAQIWWAMRRPPELGTERPPKQYLEVFDPSLRHQIYTGNTPAPKGHYVLYAFKQDRSKVSGVSGIETKSAVGVRPEAVSFYAGRVFYGGAYTSEYNNLLYYSQIIERPEQVGLCYQTHDPTSEDLRDLLPSDGGVVQIPDISRIIHLQPVGRDLLVFCDAGVWRVSGSEGFGFRANDFSVTKLSGTTTQSRQSFVSVEGLPMWWNRSGIHTVVPNDQGVLVVQSLTDQTIKKFYDEIPQQSKTHAKGTYDQTTKTVQYLYRSTETADLTKVFDYDRILVLDVRSGSFYPWSIPDTRVKVNGVFTMEGEAVTLVPEDVYAGEEQVFAGDDPVFINTTVRKEVDSVIKYIVNVGADDESDGDVPDPAEPVTEEAVFAGDDEVLAGADSVVVTL